MNKRLLAAVIALVGMTGAVMAQNTRIDARLNALAADPANYLNWTIGKKVVKDAFDAKSGAGLAASTKGFDAVRFAGEATKKAAIPVGLRGLMLYPVSDYAIAAFDDLKITANGKQITVRYVHRGAAYELVTDNKGKFDVLTGARMARGLAENVGGEFVLKAEFVKAGTDGKKMSDLDWEKSISFPTRGIPRRLGGTRESSISATTRES